MGRAFAREKGLEEFEEEFAKGAQLAQDPLAFESVAMLGDSDREILREEVVRLALPLRLVPRLTSSSAGAQVETPLATVLARRMLLDGCRRPGNGESPPPRPLRPLTALGHLQDESVTNGANLFWPLSMGLDTTPGPNNPSASELRPPFVRLLRLFPGILPDFFASADASHNEWILGYVGQNVWALAKMLLTSYNTATASSTALPTYAARSSVAGSPPLCA